MRAGFLEPLQGFQAFFFENHIGIRFHSCGECESEKPFLVARVFLQALAGEVSGVPDGFLRTFHAREIGLAFNSLERYFFVPEEIARESTLAIQLLEEVTGCD